MSIFDISHNNIAITHLPTTVTRHFAPLRHLCTGGVGSQRTALRAFASGKASRSKRVQRGYCFVSRLDFKWKTLLKKGYSTPFLKLLFFSHFVFCGFICAL